MAGLIATLEAYKWDKDQQKYIASPTDNVVLQNPGPKSVQFSIDSGGVYYPASPENYGLFSTRNYPVFRIILEGKATVTLTATIEQRISQYEFLFHVVFSGGNLNFTHYGLTIEGFRQTFPEGEGGVIGGEVQGNYTLTLSKKYMKVS